MTSDDQRPGSDQPQEAAAALVQAVWNSMPSPAVVLDGNDVIVRANAAAMQAAVAAGDLALVGASVWNLVSPSDHRAVRELLTDARSQGYAELDSMALTANEGTRYFHARCTRLGDGPAVLVVVTDITELQQTAEQAAESERRFQGIVESCNDLILLTQPDGVITYLSPSCREVVGYEPEELLGQAFGVAHPEDRSLVQAAHARAVRGIGGSGMEYRIVTKRGQTRWVSHAWSPVRAEGEVRYIVSIIRDATDRAEMIAALRESRQQYQATLDALEDPVYVASADHEVAFMNAAMKAEFGDQVGRKCYEVFHGRSSPCEDWCDLPAALHGESSRREWTSPSGNVYDTLTAPLQRADGSRAKVTVFRDITNRKLMEQGLLESQKLAAVGELAGGVAHEFNNILATIHGYAQLGLSSQEPGAVQKALQVAVSCCERASRITENLVSFARSEEIEADDIDITTCAEAALSLVEHELRQANIEVRRFYQEHLPTVRADASRMQQVFLNLLFNSRDAMPNRG